MNQEMPDWVMIPEPPASIKVNTTKWGKPDFEGMVKKGQVVMVGPTGWSKIIQSSALETVIKGDSNP